MNIAKVDKNIQIIHKVYSEPNHFSQRFSINGLHNVQTAPKFCVKLIPLSFAQALCWRSAKSEWIIQRTPYPYFKYIIKGILISHTEIPQKLITQLKVIYEKREMDSPSICFYSSNDDLPLILTWGLRAWNINGNPNCSGLSAISRKKKNHLSVRQSEFIHLIKPQ
jgi:hypothetical protein